MAAAKLTMDFAAVGLWLRTSPELRAYLDDLGRKGLAYAQSIAPVGTRTTRHSTPGQYRDSLFYEITEGPHRMQLKIGAQDFTSWWVEYGSKHNTKHAVLRRTLDYLRSGSASDASSYAGIGAYDAANAGSQDKRGARRTARTRLAA